MPLLVADVVGFTPLAQRLPPAETVGMLDRLFSSFDVLVERHGLEKIKTIGDAYMAVGGLFEPRADHARRVVGMACRMPAVVASIGSRPALAVRIGIHTGAAVAGVRPLIA